MTHDNNITIRTHLRTWIDRADEGGWISHCPALQLYSQGNTLAEAKKNIREAINLWMTDCLERGTLREALAECGFGDKRKKIKPGKGRLMRVTAEFPFAYC